MHKHGFARMNTRVTKLVWRERAAIQNSLRSSDPRLEQMTKLALQCEPSAYGGKSRKKTWKKAEKDKTQTRQPDTHEYLRYGRKGAGEQNTNLLLPGYEEKYWTKQRRKGGVSLAEREAVDYMN
eukprot:4573538-Pleurochrysis_carterae.AAC.2